MRMIVADSSDWVCRWVAEQLGTPEEFQHRAYGIAIIFRDQPIAGVVYHDWTEHNCFISLASTSPHWASKMTLRAIFGYAFFQMGVGRVSVLVKGPDPQWPPDHKNNVGQVRWRKTLINRFGFVFEGRLDDLYGPNYHGYLLRMKRSECRWIDNELWQGRRRQRAAV